MYKVYFLERVIFIGNGKIPVKDNTNLKICSKASNIKEEWKSFRKSKTMDAMWLKGNAEEVLEEFQSLFKPVSAAGGLVSNKKGELLLIFRYGKWDLPKGKVEKGESIKNAALREVNEECGVTGLKITKQLPSTMHIYELKGKEILKTSAWFKMACSINSIPVPQKNEGIEKAIWVKPEKIKVLEKNMYLAIKQVLREALVILNKR
jgi:ADP-ribose pyrophosphatase YjhB (NUDIX family)